MTLVFIYRATATFFPFVLNSAMESLIVKQQYSWQIVYQRNIILSESSFKTICNFLMKKNIYRVKLYYPVFYIYIYKSIRGGFCGKLPRLRHSSMHCIIYQHISVHREISWLCCGRSVKFVVTTNEKNDHGSFNTRNRDCKTKEPPTQIQLSVKLHSSTQMTGAEAQPKQCSSARLMQVYFFNRYRTKCYVVQFLNNKLTTEVNRDSV